MRSALGSKVRSPFGAFVARTQLAIETLPLYLEDGLTYNITGRSFGEIQGTGKLEIANSLAFDDVVVEQTVSAWTNTELTFTYDRAGLPTNGILFVRAENNAGQFDVAVTQSIEILGYISGAQATSEQFSRNDGLDIAGIVDSDSCGDFMYPMYCGPVFLIQFGDEGYGPPSTFLADSPGFTIVGVTTGTEVTFPQGTFVPTADDFPYVWSSPVADAEASTSSAIIKLLLSYSGCASRIGGGGGCTTAGGGWDYTSPGPGEDVVLIPMYPLSIQITTPTTNDSFPPWLTIDFSAYSYAEEGDISSGIDWESDIDGALGTGSDIASTLTEATHVITAVAINAHGQRRYSEITIDVAPITGLDSFPYSVNEAGGQRISIYGIAFTSGVTVEIGGVPATSVVFHNTRLIQCIAPAGSGLVDIVVDDGTDTTTLTEVVNYGTETDISVDLVSPDYGGFAGGIVVTITGTGFTADCTVIFGNQFEGGEAASDVVFVSSTEITCLVPEWVETPGDVSITVLDTSTFAGDILVNGFTYIDTPYAISLDGGTFTLTGQDVTLTYP